MINRKPETITFGSIQDIVDYVTKGLPPSKQNFDKMIFKVRNPDDDDTMIDNDGEPQVVIRERSLMQYDNDQLADVLERVYRNNVRNRNLTIGIGTIVTAVLLGSLIRTKAELREERKK